VTSVELKPLIDENPQVDRTSSNLPERNSMLPYVVDPVASFIDYSCWIEVWLASGRSVHKVLPQTAQTPDTLGVVAIYDPTMGSNKNGVNTISAGEFADIVQQMATSKYYFVLKGWGIRVGYPVPVPKLNGIAGLSEANVIEVSYRPTDNMPGQWSLGNRLEGNFSGVPFYFNQWELWYTVTHPPKSLLQVPQNLAQHIAATDQSPSAMAVPVTG
jgi:hypothetical protein